MNVTSPEGMPTPELLGVTPVVKVIGCPVSDGFADEVGAEVVVLVAPGTLGKTICSGEMTVPAGITLSGLMTVAVGLELEVGVGPAVGVGVGVGVGPAVGVGVGVGPGTGVPHEGLVTVLLSKVTAPFCASSLPSTVAVVLAVIEVRARMLPWNCVVVPRVAELPICQ
jgi:hypothetical protein